MVLHFGLCRDAHMLPVYIMCVAVLEIPAHQHLRFTGPSTQKRFDVKLLLKLNTLRIYMSLNNKQKLLLQNNTVQYFLNIKHKK